MKKLWIVKCHIFNCLWLVQYKIKKYVINFKKKILSVVFSIPANIELTSLYECKIKFSKLDVINYPLWTFSLLMVLPLNELWQ